MSKPTREQTKFTHSIINRRNSQVYGALKKKGLSPPARRNDTFNIPFNLKNDSTANQSGSKRQTTIIEMNKTNHLNKASGSLGEIDY